MKRPRGQFLRLAAGGVVLQICILRLALILYPSRGATEK
jgi:hypothetical protein